MKTGNPIGFANMRPLMTLVRAICKEKEGQKPDGEGSKENGKREV